MNINKNIYLLYCICVISQNCFAYQALSSNNQSKPLVEKRVMQEDKIESNPFGITFYKQNYILPFYYTGSPYTSIYENHLDQKIKNAEIKYQLSLKVPVWKNILFSGSSLYFGYTQLSYWQAYSKNAFFRETDFQPELFVATPMSIPILWNWKLNAVNFGAVHESNGFGNDLERSWNRVYLEAVASNNNFMISFKPWLVLHDSSYREFNPDLANYLGYGEVCLSYKFYNQVLTLRVHSLIERGGKRATGILNYSFPLTNYLYGFIQVFSGYGQSLIEYNHRTNSVGVGIAFSNLV